MNMLRCRNVAVEHHLQVKVEEGTAAVVAACWPAGGCHQSPLHHHRPGYTTPPALLLGYTHSTTPTSSHRSSTQSVEVIQTDNRLGISIVWIDIYQWRKKTCLILMPSIWDKYQSTGCFCVLKKCLSLRIIDCVLVNLWSDQSCRKKESIIPHIQPE